jgi:hypothetical protein
MADEKAVWIEPKDDAERLEWEVKCFLGFVYEEIAVLVPEDLNEPIDASS